MWKCKHCGEEVEDTFDKCWKCNAPDDPASPRIPNKPQGNAISRFFTDKDEEKPMLPVSPGKSAKGKPVVLSHWYSLVPNFNTSTKEFYEAVEQRLKDQQVPGLDLCRVEYAEGGLLSGKRQYLRLSRERLAFDICAAPFGTSFFFSCRFSVITSLHLFRFFLLILFIGGPLTAASYKLFGLIYTVLIVLGICLLVIALLSNLVYWELNSLDALLLEDPLVGGLYERFFRKETYYREDTRLMYRDTVNAVVKEAVEKTTGMNGIKLVQYMEKAPLFNDLYKPTLVSLPK